ncbi:hypothetical protein PsorP6_015924 [Peronosclerospora sorghi]|uniref:Uncharacterized protein n=1 Tax=Peronosclerospora sorghi TaxID=230839 RepID=A0ACC0WR99_9STRA|nr:hypothetical protein PsorP6_015924 [Peronosclerospora sorghi]
MPFDVSTQLVRHPLPVGAMPFDISTPTFEMSPPPTCPGKNVPLDPVDLTVDEQERCHELTLQFLDRTLRSYEEREATRYGTSRCHSTLDSVRWKRHLTRSNVSLYSERDHGGQRDLHMPGEQWKYSDVLLAVGTIRAPLDDVMLGLTTPTFGDLRIRAASTVSHDIRGATLATIAGPTELDPFQSLSLMWIVGEPSWPLNLLVRPRDFMSLSATGIITRGNGDRIGYDLLQPAQLPQRARFPNRRARGKLMYGALFKEQHDGTVDVYIQLHIQGMGYLADTFHLNSCWSAMLGFWEAPRLAMEKKLQWWILHRSHARRKQSTKHGERRTTSTKSGEFSCTIRRLVPCVPRGCARGAASSARLRSSVVENKARRSKVSTWSCVSPVWALCMNKVPRNLRGSRISSGGSRVSVRGQRVDE